MKKYFILALFLHGIFFLSITKPINLVEKNDISIKNNISISYNDKRNIKTNYTEKIEKTDEIKREESKIPEMESKMTREKKDKKEETKKIKKSEPKKDTIPKENNNIKDSQNNNFIPNSDGTYTATKGISFEILKQVDPNYPRQAESMRFNKTVVVEARFLIDLNGNVEDIKILKSHEKFGFDKEVILALKKWRFKPIYHEGKKIKVYFQKEFIFAPKS